MKNKPEIYKYILPLIIFIVGFGLVAGCSNDDSDTNKLEKGTTETGQTISGQQDMNQSKTYKATLKGADEVPAVETDATGSVTVTVNGDSMHVTGQFTGLSSEYMASHIHKAVKGKNGSPVQPLDPEIGNDNMSGTWDASYKLDKTMLNALDGDSLYINVHSADHKSGEIRGQLTASTSNM